MANIGMADTLILMVLALVVFGPRRLPQIGRQLGRLMYEFRKASNDFKFQMEEELRQAEEADRRKREELEQLKALTAQQPADSTGATAAAPEPATSAAEPANPYPESFVLPEAAAASPYPGEGTYPNLAGEVAAAPDAAEDETASAVEAARLRIRPATVESAAPMDTPASAAESLAPAARGENAGDAIAAAPSEPAAHHG